MKTNWLSCLFIIIVVGSLILSVVTDGPYFGYVMAAIIFIPILLNIYFAIIDSNTQPKPKVSKQIVDRSLTNPNQIKSTSATTKPNYVKFILIGLVFFTLFTCGSRKRIGAVCRDGTNSYSTGSGTCSHHNGVSRWKYEYWWD